jgi:hypothetical protein
MRALLFSALALSASLACRGEQADVLVYGGTPAGIAAALAAAQDGEKVLLVEPGTRLGGMLTNGLSHADFHSFESLSGAYLRFTQRVVDYYRPEFGERAAEVSFRGTHAEPKVNLAVFEKMLAEQPGITVKLNWALEGAETSSDAEGDKAGPQRDLEVALFTEPTGTRHSVSARFFIDATYEGDLMAAAGVPYAVGREARDEFHEPLAEEEPDAELQGYNFRLCATREPANRAAPRPPPGYNSADYAGLLPLLANGTVKGVFGEQHDRIFKAQLPELPHGKFDVNDMSLGPVRLSLPGENLAWPDGGGGVAIRDGATAALDRPPFSRLGLATARQKIYDEHFRWTVGLLYFLQHDPAVPEPFREEALQWGWCRDEFLENGHVPEQLYVREARRLVGRYVFTQNDTMPVPGDVRAPLEEAAVAMGDYGPDCHGTDHEGSRFGGQQTGEFYEVSPPYQIPFGVMVPRQTDGLLVACAVSASHVGFCAVRYEPIWMALGEAAGHAAHLAREYPAIDSPKLAGRLQRLLWADGSATAYVSDVPPGDPLFTAAQWWASAGGFHFMSDDSAPPHRGQRIIGQYSEAYPHQAADLARPLDAATAARWSRLALTLGLDPKKLPAGGSRGEWVSAAWKAAGSL